MEKTTPLLTVPTIWLESIQLAKDKNKIIRAEISTARDEEKITRANMVFCSVCVFVCFFILSLRFCVYIFSFISQDMLGIYPEKKEWIQIKEKRGKERSSESTS